MLPPRSKCVLKRSRWKARTKQAGNNGVPGGNNFNESTQSDIACALRVGILVRTEQFRQQRSDRRIGQDRRSSQDAAIRHWGATEADCGTAGADGGATATTGNAAEAAGRKNIGN